MKKILRLLKFRTTWAFLILSYSFFSCSFVSNEESEVIRVSQLQTQNYFRSETQPLGEHAPVDAYQRSSGSVIAPAVEEALSLQNSENHLQGSWLSSCYFDESKEKKYQKTQWHRTQLHFLEETHSRKKVEVSVHNYFSQDACLRKNISSEKIDKSVGVMNHLMPISGHSDGSFLKTQVTDMGKTLHYFEVEMILGSQKEEGVLSFLLVQSPELKKLSFDLVTLLDLEENTANIRPVHFGKSLSFFSRHFNAQ